MSYKALKEKILSLISPQWDIKDEKIQKKVGDFLNALTSTNEDSSSSQRPISPPGTNGGSTPGNRGKTRFGEDE